MHPLRIIELSVEEFLKFQHHEEVLGFCKQCENYQKFWSCPSHSFAAENYFQNASNVYILHFQIDLGSLNNQLDEIAYYLKEKEILNYILRKSEDLFKEAVVFIAGHCSFSNLLSSALKNQILINQGIPSY